MMTDEEEEGRRKSGQKDEGDTLRPTCAPGPPQIASPSRPGTIRPQACYPAFGGSPQRGSHKMG
jgi:hypothetical protein